VRRLIDLVSKPVGIWWFLRFRRLFLRLCISHALQPDQAAVIYAKCPNSAQAALEAIKNSRQKVVMAVHFNRSEAEEWYNSGRIREGDWVYRGIRNLESKVLPKLDGLHFVSQFMRDYIREHHPEVARCKSIVLPNFIEDPGSAAKGEPKGDLISIGSLEPRKNQVYLVQVLHEARLLGHRYSLTLVGQGPDRRRLQRVARDLGVLDQIHFLGLRRDAARMLPMYRAYAHSALIENFPFVLIEAAAYGIPILASPVGGIPEIFFDGEQGFYWPLDDPKEGARKLIALLEDKAIYTRLADGARKQFEVKYTAELVGPQLMNFLLEIGAA
jgi:glycosyltransferase involved in cell wall biosynthesis